MTTNIQSIGIKKILIANRGEIASRVIKTCKKLNIKSVAVFSQVDYNFLPPLQADQAFLIGPAISSESYLKIERIIDAIKESGADAVHPGYGFLSENREFAKAVEDIGVRFIGPSSASIEAMGDKISSKQLAVKAGVNVVPGFDGVIKDGKHAVDISNKIGFPVILKASAGGGGKGIRVAYHEHEVEQMFISVSNEAKKSFSDDRIFIEKYIEKPRHVEIQIIGDKHGNIVCLGERECSIQRNNQKIIEESPCSFMTEDVRREMYRQSVLLAKAVGYYSAGTIEFIMDKNRGFYFLEMNTRLQVEHPVTEFVTGLDLVELMIRVADGQKLPFTDSEIKNNNIKLTGHAFEARICAEDPSKKFLPSTGWLSSYIEPEKSSNVRVDTGVQEGCFITQFYDPMIAKLITYGKTREEARKQLLASLAEFVVDGVDTNISLVEKIITEQDFIVGDISTNLIKEKYNNAYNPNYINSENLINFAIAIFFIFCQKLHITDAVNLSYDKKYTVVIDGEKLSVTLINFTKSSIEVNVAGKNYKITTHNLKPFSLVSKVLKLLINDQIKDEIFTARFHTDGGVFIKLSCLGLSVKGYVIDSEFEKYFKYFANKVNAIVKTTEFEVPISGLITQIFAKEDQHIGIGEPIITIEAMKMENIITAEFETTIKKINCKIGDAVSIGDLIIDFDNNAKI